MVEGLVVVLVVVEVEVDVVVVVVVVEVVVGEVVELISAISFVFNFLTPGTLVAKGVVSIVVTVVWLQIGVVPVAVMLANIPSQFRMGRSRGAGPLW